MYTDGKTKLVTLTGKLNLKVKNGHRKTKFVTQTGKTKLVTQTCRTDGKPKLTHRRGNLICHTDEN